MHVMCRGCECSILDYDTIFDNDYKAVSHGIPVEFQWNSNGIPWIPLGIIPGGSGIPTIDTDENISPVENPIFAILAKIHL